VPGACSLAFAFGEDLFLIGKDSGLIGEDSIELVLVRKNPALICQNCPLIGH